MKLGIMQPYIFPYIGYWQLIANTDQWVFFDVVQYNKKSWMNRNRILHPDKNKEFQYFYVSVRKHKRGSLIKDVIINNDENWKENFLGQLTVYKKLNAPYYKEVRTLVCSIFEKEYTNFLSLTIDSTKAICQYLDIDLNYKVASELDFDRDNVHGPGDWALEISKKQNATQYINLSGGYKIFDEEKYFKSGMELLFLKSKLPQYKQSWRNKFIEGLSMIDVMMFNSKEEIKRMLSNDFLLLAKSDL